MEPRSKIKGKYTIYFRNEKEFESIYRQMFIEKEYAFFSKKKSPFIIDCGSHIGISILYFKFLYPESQILGFEPNPETFKILRKNIHANNLKNVKVVNAALSDRDGFATLHGDNKKTNPWNWGDTLVNNMWGFGNTDRRFNVKTVKLSSYINKKVDLLKLDVEGVEQKVLQESEKKLSDVNEIIFEYHYTGATKGTNNYGFIKSLLERKGFKVLLTAWMPKITFPSTRWGFPSLSWFAIVKAKKSK